MMTCMEKDTNNRVSSIERSIFKHYRKELWRPFIHALKTYELIQEGDSIAICISGGKDSMLLAVLMKMLQRYSDFPFSLTFLSMDPGYSEDTRKTIIDNAQILDIPLDIFENNIFDVAYHAPKNPCYLCARMRRGALYAEAKKRGCNKIALGHHLNDVIETTLLSMMWGAQLQAMPPKLTADNFEGMELIRPLYCIKEQGVINWARNNDLHFIQCACRFTEEEAKSDADVHISKRQEIKELITKLKLNNPSLEKNIFKSIHALSLDSFPAYKSHGETHSFFENYNN